MDTAIRKGQRKFFGDAVFSHGIARSGFFNKRESVELEDYGHSFTGLLSGELSPINDEEASFIEAIKSASESELYAVRLWRKYLQSVEKTKVHHGFMQSESKAKKPVIIVEE